MSASLGGHGTEMASATDSPPSTASIGGVDASVGKVSPGMEGSEEHNSFKDSKVVEAAFKRPMSVRVGVLTAFIDESPFLSSAALFKLKEKKASVREIFDSIDADKSGSIEKGEVKALLERLWEREVHESEVAEATTALDTDKDDQVSFGEFSDWFLKSDMLLTKELEDKFWAVSTPSSPKWQHFMSRDEI